MSHSSGGPINSTLPLPATPFVGRDDELTAIAHRLANPACRFLTLVGPGGMGKTRLALQAAADHIAHFSDGVCVVNLASVDSPSLVASTIAAALGLSLYGSDDPHRQIASYLSDRHLLLVLDNFELLVGGAGLVADLLTHAPRLKLLVTSRERLNVREEWALPIMGMPYPTPAVSAHDHNDFDESGLDEIELSGIEQFSAVRLFVQRAQQVQPAFALAQHRRAVAAICRQVEGMPLALELAASWLRVMPADQIALRLSHSLDFLTTPLRNAPDRHSSIRAVFDGSWNLLSPVERTALARLSVFRGGFDLAAADAVASATLPVVAALIDKSLVQADATGRCDLHELLRQYAAEKLVESGEATATATARQHLAYFLNLAEQAEAHIYGPKQVLWFDRLEAEHGNLHAALTWSLQAGERDSGLSLAAALGWFWQLRMHLREGSQWFERLLAGEGDSAPAQTRARARALHRASEIETQLNNSARAQQLAEASLACARAANDPWNTAWALAAIGLWSKHDRIQTVPFEEALALFRTLGDGWGISHCLRRLSLFLTWTGERGRAADLAEESLVLARAAQDKSAMAWSLYALGFARSRHDPGHNRAVKLFEESLPLFREIGDVNGLSMALDLLGALLLIHGQSARAKEYFEENLRLTLSRKWTPPLASANSLAGWVVLSRQADEPDRVATLFAAVEAQIDPAHTDAGTFLLGPQLAQVRSWACQPQFEEARAVGRVMTLEQAAAFALHRASAAAQPSPLVATSSLVEPLSAREIEVLGLIAQGLSNAQIAERLYLTVGTVKVHARNIYGKLGVNSRTRAVAQARQLNLI